MLFGERQRWVRKTIECIDAVILISEDTFIKFPFLCPKINYSKWMRVAVEKAMAKERVEIGWVCVFVFYSLRMPINLANSERHPERQNTTDKKWWELGADCISWDGFLRFYYANRITFADSTENFLEHFFHSLAHTACTWNSHRVVSPWDHLTNGRRKKPHAFQWTHANGIVKRQWKIVFDRFI